MSSQEPVFLCLLVNNILQNPISFRIYLSLIRLLKGNYEKQQIYHYRDQGEEEQ